MSRLERLVRLHIGFVLIAEGIALNVRGELGLAPLFVVFQGLERHGVATIGVATILTNAALFIIGLALRDRPGLGTVGQVLLVGPLADLALWATPETDSLVLRTTYLLLSLVLLSAGGALYLSADLGAGPWDAVMRGMYRYGRSVPLAVVRVAMEGSAVLLGWRLGGDVGVGTLVVGLGIGPGMALGLRLLGAMPARLTDEVAVSAGAAVP